MSDNENVETKLAGLLQPIVPPIQPFKKLTIDYLGLLPRSNRKAYILVARDTTTRFAIVKAMDKANVQTTTKYILKDILQNFGLPAEILIVQRTHFIVNSHKQLYKALGLTYRTSIAYRPQSGEISNTDRHVTLQYQ